MNPPGVSTTLLQQAIMFGGPVILEELLRAGANPDAVGGSGLTALAHAAINGNLDAGRLLLIWGANPGLPCRSGETPLQLAISQGHPAMADLLREAGTRE